MHSGFKKISLFVITGILFAVAYACYIYFKPVKNIATQKADIQISVTQLLNDFNSDSKRADSTYKNKIVEISGSLKKTEIQDSVCNVIFDNGGNYIIIAGGLQEQKKDVKLLKEGNLIKIKGIYSGFVINDETFMIPAEIKIDRCTLIK
ncbi:MAG: hypothetical protein U0U67_16265 [Chitinophagales bacterium]